ncbi:hypothetical protein GUITHDRAFT_110306 [Guillardia theta CCMP2712]|uniref:C2 domain-containing protein n=1 Tax=Guillardia theta (strain CCMP2712) TaxID=905079 RepID=L1J5T3_GUITC|nr:hypothetical protein GUITHDRAFT_110306 [Guillardia theta CCMP2712]EKX43856.1 hypothetical protein GUITHDRAFT_110306 [Guillardia theta CCMP2712]|eukprot:XP_005830836.1 hypothetical protein GUITHDRAFT_110306 [Guillardia theta CCMP2712]
MKELNEIQELMGWPKGLLVMTVIKGTHLPKTDTIGLCDPFVTISLGEHSLKTRHVRKTLNPTWNEVLELPVDDGEEIIGKYMQLSEKSLADARRTACLSVQLYDWDVTGSELIGQCTIELYALMEKISRPDRLGFDGQRTKLLVRFRFVLDEAAAKVKAAARLAREERERRRRLALALEEERRLQSQIIEENLQRQLEAKEKFLAQLQRESMVCTPALIRYESLPCTAVAAGVGHSLFINENGAVLSCGSGEWGQLGLLQPGVSDEDREMEDEDFVYEQLVSREIHFHPSLFGNGQIKIVQVAAGARHSMLLSDCGMVLSCGDGRYGALGYDERVQRTPRRFAAVGCCFHAKEIDNVWHCWQGGQDLRAWEEREHGSVPQSDLDGRCVSLNVLLAMLRVCEQTVYAFGSGGHGRLGLGEETDKILQPTRIHGLLSYSVMMASAGDYHSLFLTSEQEVFATGSNQFGQLGLAWTGREDRKRYVLSPVRMEAMVGVEVVHVTAGSLHSLLVGREGDVFACGCNFNGQCGGGDKSALEAPTKIKFLEGIKIIAASAGTKVIGRIRNQSLAKAWDAWLRELDESCDISDWLNEAAGTQQEDSWSEALAEAQTLLTWVFRDM